MSARIILNGKVVWSDAKTRENAQEYKRRKQALPLDRDGNFISHHPVPADSPDSPFRAGEARYDAEEDIHYRVVKSVDPKDGWATTKFWQDRWGVVHKELLTLVRRGLLDSATLELSQVRFYRCRNESRVLRDPILAQTRIRRQKLADQKAYTQLRKDGNAYARSRHWGTEARKKAAEVLAAKKAAKQRK